MFTQKYLLLLAEGISSAKSELSDGNLFQIFIIILLYYYIIIYYNFDINIRDKNIYNILGKIYCDIKYININNTVNP